MTTTLGSRHGRAGLCRLDPVDARHPDVQQDEVRLHLADEGVGASRGPEAASPTSTKPSGNASIRLLPSGGRRDGLVVDDQHADGLSVHIGLGRSVRVRRRVLRGHRHTVFPNRCVAKGKLHRPIGMCARPSPGLTLPRVTRDSRGMGSDLRPTERRVALRPLRVVLADDSYLVREALAPCSRAAPRHRRRRVCGDATALMGRSSANARRRRHGHPDAADRDRRGNSGRSPSSATDASRDRRRRPQPVRRPALRARVAGATAPTGAPTCSRNASTTAAARRRDRGGRRRRLASSTPGWSRA